MTWNPAMSEVNTSSISGTQHPEKSKLWIVNELYVNERLCNYNDTSQSVTNPHINNPQSSSSKVKLSHTVNIKVKMYILTSPLISFHRIYSKEPLQKCQFYSASVPPNNITKGNSLKPKYLRVSRKPCYMSEECFMKTRIATFA